VLPIHRITAFLGFGDDEEDSYADLEETSKERARMREVVLAVSPATLIYNAGYTAVATAVKSTLFLLNLAVYFLMRYYVINRPLPILPISFIGGVGGLCSFIVVFFLSSSWNRFSGIYTLAIQLSGRVQDLCIHSHALLTPAAAMRAWRYINVAHILVYMAIGNHYTLKNFLQARALRLALPSQVCFNALDTDSLPCSR
jgi:hypothetical protein